MESLEELNSSLFAKNIELEEQIEQIGIEYSRKIKFLNEDKQKEVLDYIKL